MATSSNPAWILDVGCGILELQTTPVHGSLEYSTCYCTPQNKVNTCVWLDYSKSHSPLPTAATVLSCQVPWGCALVPADLLHQLQSEVCKQVDSKIATCSFLRAFQASILDFEIVDSISQIVKAKRSSCDWLEDSIALLYTFTLLFSSCCLSIGKQDRLAGAAPTLYRKCMAFVLHVTCVILYILSSLLQNCNSIQ